MAWIAGTIALVGAALAAKNQNDAIKRQDRATSAGILQRMEATRNQSAAIQKALANLRASNDAPQVAQGNKDYLHALATATPMGSQPAQVGALSDAYRQAAGAADASSRDAAGKTAGLMAITDAPALQRQGESVAIGRLGSVLQGINSAANDQYNQTRLKVAGIRPNPWINLVASGMQAYGTGALAAGGVSGSGSSAIKGGDTANYWGSGSSLTGGNYTGPNSLSTDYTSNVRNLYGLGRY